MIKKTLINTSEYLFQESLASAYQRYQAKELDLTWIPVEQIPHSEKYAKRVTCGPEIND